MGESKSPALPLGDGASVENSIAYFSKFHKPAGRFHPNFLSRAGKSHPCRGLTNMIYLHCKSFPVQHCVEDGSLVMGNMLNAAESVGLSACWIHRAKEMFETAEGQALLKKWGVPNAENLRGVGNCILGYAAEGGKKAPAPRKENYVVLVK